MKIIKQNWKELIRSSEMHASNELERGGGESFIIMKKRVILENNSILEETIII